MEISLRVGDMILLDEKDKSYINCSSKYFCVTVCYLLSGESSEVVVNQAELIRVSSADKSRA